MSFTQHVWAFTDSEQLVMIHISHVKQICEERLHSNDSPEQINSHRVMNAAYFADIQLVFF